MGEDPSAAADEIAALRRAHDRGFRHFDTAEMYGEGESERLLGHALSGLPRDELFLTSKFYPYHARSDQVISACERSLARLGTDHLDLYLLHWPGGTPFEETLEGAERLLSSGKIAAFGISNFDAQEMVALEVAGLTERISVNQVLYNPARRGIEFDLLPWLTERGMVCVAYTPIEPDRLGRSAAFCEVAREAGCTPAELALAWHMTHAMACPIPKSATPAHVDALADAAAMRLSADVMAAIDAVYPPPDAPLPLEIL